MKLSIVIATWNSKDVILDCLNSIYESDDYKKLQHKLEVIVIDNNSFDNTIFEIENSFPNVKLIKNSTNIGYAPACNQGMKISKGEYILLLGSDTKIKNNTLLRCVDFLDNNKLAGAVACKLLSLKGEIQGNCKKFPTLKNAIYTYLSLNKFNHDYDMLWFKYNKEIEVDQADATFLMIRNNILQKINYFDEKYKILYNDVDLCYKIKNENYKIYFIPYAEIIHRGSYSTKRANLKLRYVMYKDIIRYYKKNFGLKAYILLPILGFRFLLISILKK